jgi:hypothetical protein
MKVIFLDWDGVLNSDKWVAEREQRLEYAVGNYGYREKYLEEADLLFDPYCVALLNQIVERADAKIVLSTSHRKHQSLTRACRMLRHRGLSKRCIVGATPDLKHAPREVEFHRGQEIQAWLEWVGLAAENCVILDDDIDMGDLAHRHVHTNYTVGLTASDVDRAVELLKGRLI